MEQREGTSGPKSRRFPFSCFRLFKRSSNSKRPAPPAPGSGPGEQQGSGTPKSQEAATLTRPRRTRPDSPRDTGEPEGAFQQPKRQHSSSMEDDSVATPPVIAAPQLGGPGGGEQPAGHEGGDAAAATVPPAAAPPAGEVLYRASSRKLSVEVKSHSFPQSHARGGPELRTEQGPVSPRRTAAAAAAAAAAQQHVCPPYGHKAVIGRRPKMEDAYSAVPFLLEVPISKAALDELVPPRIANNVRKAGAPSSSGAAAAVGAGGGDNAMSEASTATAAGAPEGGAAAGGGGEGSSSGGGRGGGGTAAGSLLVDLPAASASGGLVESQSSMFVETLHFFGVFDGHGGADAAMHCAKTMHERVREVMLDITSPTGAAGGAPSPRAASSAAAAAPGPEASSSGGGGAEDMDQGPSSGGNGAQRGPSPLSDYADATADLAEPASSSTSSESSFLDCDVEGGGGTRPSNKVEGLPCTSETVEAALTKAFHMTDEDFGQAENAALVGTTAVVALVGTRMLYVANCGDSRAVLCRNGMAVALTDDHKAAREDETARVEAAGGQILFWNGVRVMGVLAVSRAIGDHCLRPFVIAQPEVTIIARHAEDELLLLASDGLWDVMNNQEACTLAKKCLQRARQRGATRAKASSIAASVLVRAAVDRGSRDNVTVVIVDLSPATREELEAEAQRAELQQESSAGEAGGEGGGHPAGGEGGKPGEVEGGRGAARPRRPSADHGNGGAQKEQQHSVPSPFAALPPTAPSPFEQMQQQQQQQQQEGSPPPPPADAPMLSPFGSVPLPTDDSSPF